MNPAGGLPDKGIVVSTADVPGTPTIEYKAALPPAVPTIPGTATGNAESLAYKTPLAVLLAGGTTLSATLKNHVVLLRRLANPHLPGPTNTNPYITIDFMDNLSTFDAIRMANGTNTAANRQELERDCCSAGLRSDRHSRHGE